MSCTGIAKEKMTDSCRGQNTPHPHETIDGQDFVKLPGGRVTLGDSDTKFHNPVHRVRIDPFLVATTEVTNAQMDAYIAAQGARNHALISVDIKGQTHILARGTEEELRSINTVQFAKDANLLCGALVFLGVVRVVPAADRLNNLKDTDLSAALLASDHPATMISWYEAFGYTEYMSRKTGREVRLLTSDEWEYAAKGGQNLRYATPTGELTVANHHLAQYDTAETSSVGNYPANPFGLQDMTGNVWEWTSDSYSATNSDRVICGGGSTSGDYAPFPSTTFRGMKSPFARYTNAGFRIAVSATRHERDID